jgi:hypothetical protein
MMSIFADHISVYDIFEALLFIIIMLAIITIVSGRE